MNATIGTLLATLKNPSCLVRLLPFVGVFALLVIGMEATAADRTGQQVVAAVCAACHTTGLNGAPKIGDKNAWRKRASQGLSSLTQHAVDGIRNMPAHGGQPNLSDLEIARAITTMVNESGGHWVAPINPDQYGKERSGESIVAARCSECHAKGVGGAPRIGDLQDWAPRVRRGIGYLVRSAIHGHGGMPPRGGEANLTDSELSSAILYMINPASAHPVTPPAQASSAMEPNHQIVDGVEIYLGYATAASISELPANAPERTMHGGIPRGPNYYHVNVSLFDATSHKPIDDASVQMEFQWPGVATRKVDMARMPFEGGGSYGNYVQVAPNLPCRITLHIVRPAGGEPVEAVFKHEFQ